MILATIQSFFLPALVCVFAYGCTAEPPPERGIYYWQTTWSLDSMAQRELADHQLRDVYVRLFDIDWDFNQNKTRPKGPLVLPRSLDAGYGLRFTPVVFLVNRVLLHHPDPEALGIKLINGIDRFTENNPELKAITALQIDCDWTPRTRSAYFRLLSTIKRERPELDLSVTVRLHQYRDREANDIPPADRGLLMCYNMAPVQQRQTRDAIYDEAILKGYLKAPAYPIPLDAGLPIFNWAAAFRGEAFLGLTTIPPAAKKVSQEYVIERDTVLSGKFLRPGDVLRLDGLKSREELDRATAIVRSRVDVENILYFDWQRGGLGVILGED